MSKYTIKNVEGAEVGQASSPDGVFGIGAEHPRHPPGGGLPGQLRSPGHPLREEPPRGLRRRREAVPPEGHRSRPPGLHPRRQWTGGGVVFGPTPRTHNKRINNKMVKLALSAPCSPARSPDAELVLVDALSFEKPSTKQAKAVLGALGNRRQARDHRRRRR